MEKVQGIGGIFFRSKKPEKLAKWYKSNLGINLVPKSFDDTPWIQEPGPTVFAPFPEDTDYFGENKKMWMINFRVKNLDGMVSQLRESGIEVTVDTNTQPLGRFARLYDPDGNPVELWEAVQ
jgi:hypothetical protein